MHDFKIIVILFQENDPPQKKKKKKETETNADLEMCYNDMTEKKSAPEFSLMATGWHAH